jgi:1-acyl-sn-glycerol-3-phosphate acyltransferase
MDERDADMPVSVFRGCRVAIHLLYGLLLAIPYPHLDQIAQRRTLESWSRQLLAILNIAIRSDGIQPARGCLIVANHVSWLDIYLLNAIHPARFIAKSEVRDWPVIGWLSTRCGTIFIERALRRNAAQANRLIGYLLQHGECIALFPEGTTTDGKQVGHFHSALIQPAIDAGASVCPVALRYQLEDGESCSAAAFIGDTTLLQSIWRILRCRQLNASVLFTPALPSAGVNRRLLARSAQAAIAQGLQDAATPRQAAVQPGSADAHDLLSSRSAYALLVDPLLHHPPR